MPPRTPAADRHFDQVSSKVALAYFQDASKYVASRVFASVPVSKKSDKIRVYSAADLLRIEAEEMAEGTAAPLDTTGTSTVTYSCTKYGSRDYITPEDKANDDGPIPLEDVVVETRTQACMTKMERSWAAANMDTSVWAHDCQGKASGETGKQFLQWDKTGADPIADVAAKGSLIYDGTGFEMNVGVIARDAFNLLKNHDKVRERFNYTNSDNVTAEMLAKLFELDELIVASAIYNAAAPGATADMTKIFTNNMLLAHRSKTPSLKKPSAGYTMLWTSPIGAPKGTRVAVRKIPRPSKGDRTDYEAIMYWDQKVIATDLGAYMYELYSTL
jgi:hypothetical protein